jgi:hypothetical protein
MFPPQAPSPLAEIIGVELSHNYAGESSMSSMDDEAVLCHRCVHGHMIKSRAATQNRKPDGSPYYFLYGQCLRVSPPMALDDLRVEHCNQFDAKEPTT